MTERAERRLAAIVSADVVGYSRLMQTDEAGTHARLRARYRDLVVPSIERYGGRVFKSMGDGLLAEFPSVVSATERAIDTQLAVDGANQGEPADRRIEYRIGVNLGDVIIDGDDIYGDGVNIAARLQEIAPAGGVCLADDGYRHVRGKITASLADRGEVSLKNLLTPVRVWQWPENAGQAVNGTVSAAPARQPIADKPSIAVLPFTNMSGDPEQEFLADGLAEDIITSLSKISEMFVIARNSSFAYKGTSPDIRQVARELGVRNVLEGSVRRSGNRVRITAQLFDAKTGSHHWAERYDRALTDVFELQDEITQEIVTALQVKLTEGQQAQIRRRQTASIDAWECFVRGISDLRRYTREANAEARARLERALELDPDFAAAWTFLGWTYMIDARAGWNAAPAVSLERSSACVEKSLALDPSNPEAHALIGAVRMHQRRHDEAIAAGETALALGPNIAENFVMLGQTLNYCGRPEEGTALVEKAMRLSPFYPDNWIGILANGYRLMGRHEEAIALDRERLGRNPDNIFSDFRLAALYMELGREEQARSHARQALKKNPGLSLQHIRVSEPYRDDAYLERYLDSLRRAGFPDE